jgi:ubiquinone/menaquinone biosynthesis C-methylase UbiE
MFRYYDERAPEYEDAYLLGTGTASIADPTVFQSDAKKLAEIVGRCVAGRVIDIAAGTAFWLPYYASHVSTITLIDQSRNMLDECRKKVTAVGLDTITALIQADVLEYEFPRGQFDFALIGFLISHLTERQEGDLFAALRRMLTPPGRFLVLDSAWSHARACVNRKVEEQERKLNDGSVFRIFKRYFDRDDISRWQERHGVRVRVEYFGAGLLAVSGAFGPAAADDCDR